MTTGKNILNAQRITFPEYHKHIPLNGLTYKWDDVPVNEWTDYADKWDIPYKDLFVDMKKQGLLYPVMVRDLKNNGIYRKYNCGGRRIIWAKRNGYTHISAYIIPDWISPLGSEVVDKIIKDQWFRID
tara:strand:- start:284 stop:667 length:384 start_codon:yes stop_codon:yes gene_type:complete